MMFLETVTPGVTDSGVMEKILDAAGSAIEFSGQCLNAMVNNPLYLFFLAVGLVGVGLGLVRKLRRTAKG